MVEEGILVIVEVRMRTRYMVCSAAESVDAHKQARIILATRHFVATRPRFREWPIRFDLVAISGDASDNSLNWTRDAFRP